MQCRRVESKKTGWETAVSLRFQSTEQYSKLHICKVRKDPPEQLKKTEKTGAKTG